MVDGHDEEGSVNMPVSEFRKTRDRLDGPETAEGRMYEWSRCRHFTPPNPWPASPFHKIHVMQENAGMRGSGLQFDVIDGVSCRPDGGMADFCERHDSRMTDHLRSRETYYAVMSLRDEHRAVLMAKYRVENRERPRTLRAAAEVLGVAHTTLADRLERALIALGGVLCLPPTRKCG